MYLRHLQHAYQLQRNYFTIQTAAWECTIQWSSGSAVFHEGPGCLGTTSLICLPLCATTPPQGMGVGVQCVPFGGFDFISPVFRIHVLPLNYIQCITCTVKSLTSPTCVSFKLFNVLSVHVLCAQLSLWCLRHVHSFKLQSIHWWHTFVRGIPGGTWPHRQAWWPVSHPWCSCTPFRWPPLCFWCIQWLRPLFCLFGTGHWNSLNS